MASAIRDRGGGEGGRGGRGGGGDGQQGWQGWSGHARASAGWAGECGSAAAGRGGPLFEARERAQAAWQSHGRSDSRPTWGRMPLLQRAGCLPAHCTQVIRRLTSRGGER